MIAGDYYVDDDDDLVMDVDLESPGLSVAEHRIVLSWLHRGTGPHADADGEEVSDGRHRLWNVWKRLPEAVLPIRSDCLSYVDEALLDLNMAEILGADARKVLENSPVHVLERSPQYHSALKEWSEKERGTTKREPALLPSGLVSELRSVRESLHESKNVQSWLEARWDLLNEISPPVPLLISNTGESRRLELDVDVELKTVVEGGEARRWGSVNNRADSYRQIAQGLLDDQTPDFEEWMSNMGRVELFRHHGPNGPIYETGNTRHRVHTVKAMMLSSFPARIVDEYTPLRVGDEVRLRVDSPARRRHAQVLADRGVIDRAPSGQSGFISAELQVDLPCTWALEPDEERKRINDRYKLVYPEFEDEVVDTEEEGGNGAVDMSGGDSSQYRKEWKNIVWPAAKDTVAAAVGMVFGGLASIDVAPLRFVSLLAIVVCCVVGYRFYKKKKPGLLNVAIILSVSHYGAWASTAVTKSIVSEKSALIDGVVGWIFALLGLLMIFLLYMAKVGLAREKMQQKQD